MPDIPRVGDLEVGQDLKQEQRLWKIQRVGWVAIGLVILAALLGLFGQGPLSRTSVEGPHGLFRLQYDRLGRHGATSDLRVHFEPDAARRGKVRLWMSHTYLRSLQVKQVLPQPEEAEAGPDGLTYVFAVAEPGRPTEVTFQVEPEETGLLVGRAGLDRDDAVSFRQFVYP